MAEDNIDIQSEGIMMILGVKEFKIMTKRFTKLDDELHPSDKVISNSSSLNFMAKILGYRDYNTIRPQLVTNDKVRSTMLKTLKNKA